MLREAYPFVFNACNKNKANFEKSQDSKYSAKNKIDGKQINSVLQQLNTTQELPPWLEKAIIWIHSHSGTWNSDPGVSCAGSGKCGPCSAICFGAMAQNFNNGVLTMDEYSSGLRSYRLGIIESTQNNELRLLIEFENYFGDFLHEDNLLIESDFDVPSEITSSLDCNSITIYQGTYPVYYNSETGYYQTILNATII